MRQHRSWPATKRSAGAEERLVDEAIELAATRAAEQNRELTLNAPGDVMHVVDRGEIAVIVLGQRALHHFQAVERCLIGGLDRRKLREIVGDDIPAALDIHQAVMQRADDLGGAGKRVLIRGEYEEPVRATRKRRRPTTPQLEQLFHALVEQVGFSVADITEPRPGNRTDVSAEADEIKRARWFVATQLRGSHHPPPTFEQIGSVMGGITGGRVHQIINEMRPKEEADGE